MRARMPCSHKSFHFVCIGATLKANPFKPFHSYACEMASFPTLGTKKFALILRIYIANRRNALRLALSQN